MSEGVDKKLLLSRVWQKFQTVLVIIVAIIAIVLVALKISGASSYVVLSGSMEPAYPVGSLLYVTPPHDVNSLEPGNVITFVNESGTVVTHRIVEKVYEENSDGTTTLKFRTQGDANGVADGALVHSKNVLGTPILAIPGLGFIVQYAKRPPGIYIILVLFAMLATAAILPNVLNHLDKRKEQTASNKNATI